MKKKLIFVYGTLKTGYWNHSCLGNSKCLGKAETPANYTMYDGGFPIVERNGNTSIKGEVYEVTDPAALKNVYSLEHYSGTPNKEGGNNWYDVDTIDTPFGKAEIFVMDKSGRPAHLILNTGNWKGK